MLDVVFEREFQYRNAALETGMHLPIRFQLGKGERGLSHAHTRGLETKVSHTTVKRSRSPFYGVFVFFARHFLGPLT